jgi:hypothetical protein
MQTITIEIINTKALKLLQDLEGLHLIRLHKEKQGLPVNKNWAMKYKGAMTRQPLKDIDNQLNDLRSGWE